MIIWGSKGRTKTIGTGTFFCPNCRATRQFKHEKVGKYFTLYFIPLLKTEDLGEYIECQGCLMTFKPEVLKVSKQFERNVEDERKANEFTSKISEELDSGVSIQAIAAGLVEAGIEKEAAAQVLLAATNRETKECPKCELVYKASISYCSSCGSRLTVVKKY